MNEKQKLMLVAAGITAGYVAKKYMVLSWKLEKVNNTVNRLVEIHNNRVIDERFAGIVKNYDGQY